MQKEADEIRITDGDVLIIVDVQNDFLPGGRLAVPQGDKVVPVLNDVAMLFDAHELPVYATRDWHPPGHCSFHERGGPWPPHCIAGTAGAAFASALRLPSSTTVVSKATQADRDAYSGFERTQLNALLRHAGTRRLFVGGLATDYCVLNTVRDGLANGYAVFVLADAIRAVDVRDGDGEDALAEMVRLGAIIVPSMALCGIPS